MKLPMITFASILLLTTSAFAQMADVDMNQDGMASYDELVAVYTDVTEDQFIEMDTNSDGSLDADEMTAAIDAGTLVMPQ